MGEEAKIYDTPGWQNTLLSKNEGTEINLEEYRSLVGKLLYYVVKVGPECGNDVRDLARYMSNPGEDQWKAMRRVVGYLKGKNLHGHVMRRPKDLKAVLYCDASYATDKDQRRSVSGTLGGMIVNWSSCTQKVATLSSTESIYCIRRMWTGVEVHMYVSAGSWCRNNAWDHL